MTRTGFLLLLVSALPLLNYLLISFCLRLPKLVNFICKLTPFLFLAGLAGLYQKIKYDNPDLILFAATTQINLAIGIDKISLIFLFLLNFIWLIFVFYSQRFLDLIPDDNPAKESNSFKSFFALIIFFTNLVIISKNLISILFFYDCLLIFCYLFSSKFFYKEQNKFSYFFTAIIYLESIFLFLAIIATWKFSGQIDFAAGGIISAKIGSARYGLLLILYLSGLFLCVFIPSYVFYRKANFDPLVIYPLFFIAYGISTLCIFIKLLAFVFGFEALAKNAIFLQSIAWILLFNLTLTSIFLLFSKGLKASFFYLFFHQFLFALFAILIFATFDESKIFLTLFSFLLSFTLIFLCISNFVLYLSKSKARWIGGIFYDLKITSFLLIFGVLNLSGVVPGISMVEKFFLLKILVQKKLLIPQIIFALNFVTLIFFAGKIFYPLFVTAKGSKKDKKKESAGVKITGRSAGGNTREIAKEIAKEIDLDSGLILTALIVGISVFSGLVFFPLLINLL
jgi:formate hydrogenlyase subunit 3/multisubunit Na+/H+ antiporter MnhD subunit